MKPVLLPETPGCTRVVYPSDSDFDQTCRYVEGTWSWWHIFTQAGTMRFFWRGFDCPSCVRMGVLARLPQRYGLSKICWILHIKSYGFLGVLHGVPPKATRVKPLVSPFGGGNQRYRPWFPHELALSMLGPRLRPARRPQPRCRKLLMACWPCRAQRLLLMTSCENMRKPIDFNFQSTV